MADGLALLFTLKAKNEAAATIKSVEGQIAQLKARMKEVRAENDVPFKTQRLSALGDALKAATTQHKELTGAAKQSAQALNQDLSSALGTVSPQLASLAGSAGPISLVVAGFIASAAAVGLLGKALFDASSSAAEFQGKMFDLSQQTGVAVETLSALEVVAKTTGGNIESVAASLGIFQRNLEKAQDSTSKVAGTFKQLGVDTKDTESALRETLKALAAMPEGFSQTAKALELFGRGGKGMLAILKEMGGDLDGTIDKFREMGILISTEDAKAADDFNDQLAILGFQLRSLGATIGKEVMPVALDAIQQLSKALNENRDAINDVAKVAGLLSNLFTGPLKGAIFAVSAAWANAKPGLDAIAAAYQFIADAATAAANAVSTLGAVSGGAGGSISGVSGGIGNVPQPESGAGISIGGGVRRRRGSGGGRGGGARDTGAADANRELAQQIDAFQTLSRGLAEVLDVLGGVDTKTQEYAVTQSIANGVLEKASPSLQKMSLEAAKQIDFVTKQIALTKQLTEFQKDQDEELAGPKGPLAQAQALIESLQRQGLALSAAQIFWLQFNATLINSAEAMERLAKANAEAMVAGLLPEANVTGGEVPGSIFDQLGEPPDFDPWIEQFQALKDIGTDAFQSLAQGVGDMVQAWVLYGTAGPNAMKKMVASVLAGVAAQSAVLAIFELAKGFAALFFNPVEAAAHFQAAAMFGGLALGAGIAGRAVAGDSFQKGGNGSGGSGGRGSASTPEKPLPIDLNRTQRNEQIHIFLHGEPGPGFHDAIINTTVRDVQRNGAMRNLIIETAGSG